MSRESELSILKNVSLAAYNTFRIDVKAKYFVEVLSETHLKALFADELTKAEKLLIMGGGSNMLFTRDFEGLVIKMGINGISNKRTAAGIEVTAGAGVVWNDLVKYCVANNFAGIENLSLIPGTVGASPVQNIGAYGVELKDVFLSCRVFNIEKGTTTDFTAADCRFGYRDSIFKHDQKGRSVITSVSFLLSDEAKLNTTYGAIGDELAKRGITDPGIKAVSDVVSHIRVNKLPDPSTIGNAGSFFKNPVIDKALFERVQHNFPGVVHYPAADGKIKLAAGWLIEQCGFKGMVWGNTGTWKNQALVLVNHGGATGKEVFNFSEHIISSVYNKFGITLEREVNIL